MHQRRFANLSLGVDHLAAARPDRHDDDEHRNRGDRALKSPEHCDSRTSRINRPRTRRPARDEPDHRGDRHDREQHQAWQHHRNKAAVGPWVVRSDARAQQDCCRRAEEHQERGRPYPSASGYLLVREPARTEQSERQRAPAEVPRQPSRRLLVVRPGRVDGHVQEPLHLLDVVRTAGRRIGAHRHQVRPKEEEQANQEHAGRGKVGRDRRNARAQVQGRAARLPQKPGRATTSASQSPRRVSSTAPRRHAVADAVPRRRTQMSPAPSAAKP